MKVHYPNGMVFDVKNLPYYIVQLNAIGLWGKHGKSEYCRVVEASCDGKEIWLETVVDN